MLLWSTWVGRVGFLGKFEPRDLWIGAYWDTYHEAGKKMLDVYICIIPMLPIQIVVQVNR
jgi:hypothetical protein